MDTLLNFNLIENKVLQWQKDIYFDGVFSLICNL